MAIITIVIGGFVLGLLGLGAAAVGVLTG